MMYTQFKEEKTKQAMISTCLCLPLRSGVLAIGVIGATLALSGLVAYAIVQVPTLRVHVGLYFTNTSDLSLPEGQNLVVDEQYNLTNIAYIAEIVGTILGASLGLLVNILMSIGVLWKKRWFLMHWMVFHVIALVLLFITSILILVVQVNLWKLLGIIPVMVAIFTTYCWAKVYELFCSLTPMSEDSSPPATYLSHTNSLPGAPPFLRPYHINHGEEVHRKIRTDQMEGLGPGIEFYPREEDMLRTSYRSNMMYLPYDQSNHQYQPPSSSTESSIVGYRGEERYRQADK